MAGVRLHHPTMRSTVLAVELDQPYPVPYICPLCTSVHMNKVIHLHLDSEGNTIVSEQVHAALRKVDSGMFTDNPVASPPPLFVGDVEQPKREIVAAPLNTQNGHRKYVPGVTRAESRDRMRIRIPKLRFLRKPYPIGGGTDR